MEKQTIKPIETFYNGYRFRSRLEARWAVFFDALGIDYEYETEGFDLGNGVWYLPDFYIPSWDCYIEIKPITEYGYNEKADLLAQKSNKKVILCAGEPYCDGESVWRYKTCAFFPDGDIWFTTPDLQPIVFMNCRRCDGYVLDSPEYGHFNLGDGHTKWCAERGGYFGSVLDAYKKARQARF